MCALESYELDIVRKEAKELISNEEYHQIDCITTNLMILYEEALKTGLDRDLVKVIFKEHAESL